MLVPIIREPDSPRLMGVPEILTADPPGVIVVQLIARASELAVKIVPPTV